MNWSSGILVALSFVFFNVLIRRHPSGKSVVIFKQLGKCDGESLWSDSEICCTASQEQVDQVAAIVSCVAVRCNI